MSTSTTIQVLTQVDPHELFEVAKRCVGDPPRWFAFGSGEVSVLYCDPDQGAQAQLNVQYRPDGQLLDAQSAADTGIPAGYVSLMLTNSSGPGVQERHAGLVERIGAWLTSQGHRWGWIYEDGAWNPGHPAASPAS